MTDPKVIVFRTPDNTRAQFYSGPATNNSDYFVHTDDRAEAKVFSDKRDLDRVLHNTEWNRYFRRSVEEA
jgi:hypothetical protein